MEIAKGCIIDTAGEKVDVEAKTGIQRGAKVEAEQDADEEVVITKVIRKRKNTGSRKTRYWTKEPSAAPRVAM